MELNVENDKYMKQQTRPTTSLVINAIVSIISTSKIENANILELFAGSGRLGFTFLNHKAKSVTFVEKYRPNCVLIRQKAKRFGLESRCKIICKDAIAYINSDKYSYNIIFADPPYDYHFDDQIFTTISKNCLLSDCGLLIYECEKRKKLSSSYNNLYKKRERIYGDSKIVTFAVNIDSSKL